MKIAYFDCLNGAAGDMIVASLLDAGADADALGRVLSSLGVSGYALSIEKIDKQGFSATRFEVPLDAAVRQPHRHLKDIVAILDRSGLPNSVRTKAKQVFERLAEAEARVHGCPVDKVHFHEVGAVDAIVDVVSAVLALELLGIGEVVCSPIPTGSGTVTCDHGVLPVPAPATAELLKGVPLASSEEPGELTTPTGAAILTALAVRFGPVPPMTLESVGYGAGMREGRTRPNLLRVLIGQTAEVGDTDEIVVLETNLDDASPQLVAHCMDRLFVEGALDVYGVPIQMKKSRTGVLLTVLCKPGRVAAMEGVLFRETTTFGVRRHAARRTKLRRRHETVSTPFGDIRMKVGTTDDVVTASPEFEECKAAALTHNVAVREVMAAANAAWASRATR
jgi:uncharacterized protein (TIGR00299 family) protein